MKFLHPWCVTTFCRQCKLWQLHTYISQTMVRLFEKNDWPWKTVREFIISLNPNGSKVEIVEETPVLISSSTLSTAFNHIRYSHPYVLYRGKLSWNEQGSVCWTVSSSVSSVCNIFIQSLSPRSAAVHCESLQVKDTHSTRSHMSSDTHHPWDPHTTPFLFSCLWLNDYSHDPNG